VAHSCEEKVARSVPIWRHIASVDRLAARRSKVFEFGEDQLYRVEVGTVFRQEEELGVGRADGAPHGPSFVAAEIVDDDDIARLEGRDQDLLDIGEEALVVDRPVDDACSSDTIAAR
jgi:hypothetical protein